MIKSKNSRILMFTTVHCGTVFWSSVFHLHHGTLFFKMCFNTVLKSVSRFFKQPLFYRFALKIVYVYHISCVNATWPANFILFLFDRDHFICEEYKLWNTWLFNFFQPAVTSSLLVPDVLPCPLSLNALYLVSSFRVRHHILCWYKTAGKTLIFLF